MDLDRIRERLAVHPTVLDALLRDVPPPAAHFQPDGGKWSIVEVVCHLADEEREDFRRRVDLTLHRRGETWPGIDPQGWVVARRYNERSLADALADFATERARSVTWLQTLQEPDWTLAYEHPQLGTLQAGDILASWLAHDLLHLRQLTGLLWIHEHELTAAYDTRYAGDWT